MSRTYKTTALYGGAITVQLPSDFDDVSNIREVPDHQEVYLSRNNLTSVIIDIVERAEPPSHPCVTDDEALSYHYEDVVEAGHGRHDRGTHAELEEETKQWNKEKVELASLPNVPALSIVSSQHPKTSEGTENNLAGKKVPDFTAILMTLIRLVPQKADVLITINVPHVQGEYKPEELKIPGDKLGPLLEAAFEYRQKIWESFKIEDWSLFAEE